MSFSIQTNVNSLVAQENLRVNSLFQSRTIQRLTSGYRINQSGDDAAGLAVANKFRSSIAELTQGVANANDGVAQLQIMDGGINNISQMLDRLKTLATQSASGTFTGDRNTLNYEFQTDVAEIDRQAQSIGLNTGGVFAKSLSVYLGVGSGSQTQANATVGLDLSTSTVDSQSLGLKGMQAVAGTADLGASSATSVSKIVNNSANTVANPGFTTFYLSGSGFADSNRITLSVNSNVGDINALVTNINAAIQSQANGSSASAAALKAANIVASVHTDADGGQQLAFTSATTAFQVQAGDRMANALMGNFSTGSTGAPVNTTVTGDKTTSATVVGQDIAVKISGAGLAAPVTFSIDSGTYGTAGTASSGAIGNLITQVTANASLQAAGITASVNSNNQVVFTSANGQQFQVETAGDTLNALGLGAFQGSTVDYTTITAGANYNNTSAATGAQNAGVQTSLEFSINGGASIAIAPIALDGGDATAGTNTSAAYTPATVATGVNDTLTFSVDTHAVTVTLAADTAATSAVLTADNAITGHDSSGTNTHILIGIDGLGVKDVTLTANDTTLANYVADLQAGIDAAFGAGHATVGDDGSNHITITSATTGTSSGITVGSGGANNAMGNLGFATTFQAVGAAAGTTSATSLASQIQTQMNTQLTGTGAGATVSVVSGQIVITNNAKGTDHAISTMAGNAAAGFWGGAGTQSNGDGTGLNRTGDNLATAITQELAANATLSAAGLTASFAANKLTISSSNNTNFRVNAGAAPAKGTAIGTVDITSGMDFSSSPATLDVKVDGGSTQTVTLNQNYTSAATLAAAIQSQLTGATASVVDVNGKSYVKLATSTSGAAGSVQVLSSGTGNSLLGLTDSTVKNGNNEIDIGFGVSNQSFAGNLAITQADSSLNVVNAGGSSQTGGMTFTPLTGGTQALTISANNSSGVSQSLSITLAATGAGTVALANDGTGANIDAAVKYINQRLQQSNNATLEGIVAVKDTQDGQEVINFLSPHSFQVGVGTASTANQGVNGGVAETVSSAITGSGSTISIDSQDGATAAVSALATAVAKLGVAQAAIGRGQNELSYAIGLASSQITNFSSAEAQIRDADVASEAANLTKAQVLQQATMAAMAQANSAPQAVLALLRG